MIRMETQLHDVILTQMHVAVKTHQCGLCSTPLGLAPLLRLPKRRAMGHPSIALLVSRFNLASLLGSLSCTCMRHEILCHRGAKGSPFNPNLSARLTSGLVDDIGLVERQIPQPWKIGCHGRMMYWSNDVPWHSLSHGIHVPKSTVIWSDKGRLCNGALDHIMRTSTYTSDVSRKHQYPHQTSPIQSLRQFSSMVSNRFQMTRI